MNKNEIIAFIRSEIAQTGITNYELAKRSGLRESTLQRFNSDTWGQQIETLCKILAAIDLEIVIKKTIKL